MQLPPDILRLVDSALDATAVVDRELTLVAFNGAYAELAGIRERELRQRSPRAMCHEHFRLDCCASGTCPSTTALRTGRSVRLDQITAGHKDRVLIVSAAPLINEDGTPYAVMETYREVTAETELQERFTALLRLERSTSPEAPEKADRSGGVETMLRQLALTRERLVRMEKMSSLGVLVAGLAHEINNPVNFIYGNVEFVEQYGAALLRIIDEVDKLPLAAPDRARFQAACEAADLTFVRKDLGRLAQAIRVGAERVAAIVRDLRIFSHGGTGQDLRPTDLLPGLDVTLELVEPQARTRRVALVRELSALPRVRCSEAQVNQVVMNLLMNAIQAAPPGGHVWIRSRSGPPGWATIEVEDDGPGVPAGHLQRIFDPFFTTKDVGEGTGLGLSISLSLARAQGGDLLVDSPPGRGALFVLRLPAPPPSTAEGVS